MFSNLAGWHLLIILAVLALAAVWVLAFVSIARADGISGAERAIWVLVVLIVPVVGAVLWFAIGRPRLGRAG
ncbi:PLDc N-terminal domain-containing protein [Herbiconiux sp. L3-i23]|uniref:PLDc N-terminal domain-containing protein n=1 Tax=Herbiconiux sp. L3-i23 TaxID=2905871 RepID=UPI0020517F7E|nr:PLDc N-terminal domain-containing protein [Herbiconiux sp. L3-i23]BDI24075.1 hypothetical protein L3i23_28510 [Herbiconiux sp. L3-i23]